MDVLQQSIDEVTMPAQKLQQAVQQVVAPEEEADNKMGNPLVSLFWSLVTIYAVYLSFKCNKGFNFGHTILAFCCSPLYIAYQLAVNYNKCMK